MWWMGTTMPSYSGGQRMMENVRLTGGLHNPSGNGVVVGFIAYHSVAISARRNHAAAAYSYTDYTLLLSISLINIRG